MTAFKKDFIRLDPLDTVVVATRRLAVGTPIEGARTSTVIPTGHKIASVAMAAGSPVIKFAQSIGTAARDIAPGDHVHGHNLAFHQVHRDYAFCDDQRPIKRTASDSFLGFRRPSGAVGTRNYVAVIASVNCSATAARMIANAFTPEVMADYPNVDGVVAYIHGTGCGMADNGEGFEALQRVFWGYARHPNHVGVLMVGLGCEVNQIDWLLDAHGLERSELFQTMTIQSVAGLRRTVESGIARIRAMLPLANEATRTACPASDLTIALQCGGSDAWSGVTANPSLGRACDILIAQSGTAVLAETPEIYGAEHLLTRRAVSRSVGDQLLARVRWWEAYAARHGGSMDNNPSPGNKKGGLTTILEKSLGAVSKGGTTPLTAVRRYAEPTTAKGLIFMDSPGYDPASVTGQIAAGCNLVCFTTGRGSAFGSKPAPTVKIVSNSDTYARMSEDMDINAGEVLTGDASVEAKGEEIFRLLLRVASGHPSRSELLGLGDHEFVPWQIGAVM